MSTIYWSTCTEWRVFLEIGLQTEFQLVELDDKSDEKTALAVA